MKRLSIILFLISTHLFPVSAQRGTGELSVLLDTVTVKATANTNTVKTASDGSVDWNLRMMDLLPKMMGNADPISYSKLLPGVQSTGEFNGGIHINGSENSHNMISVLDVPIYNVNHLLGFFSAFIPTHYSSMSLHKTPQTAGSPNRLGGELMFRPFTERESEYVSGDVSVGLLSSQGTVKVPTGKKSLLTASLRAAYINLLYSRWMEVDRSTLDYSFFDSNLTWSCNLNDRNVIMADAYWGRDNGGLMENSFVTDSRSIWGNDAESFHWIHDGKNGFDMKHTVYRSNSFTDIRMVHEGGRLKAPSSITDLGYKGNVEWKGLTLGVDALYHDFVLQSPVIDDAYIITATESPHADAWEYSAYSDYSVFIMDRLNLRAGLRGGMFVSNDETYRSLDPSFAATYYGQSDSWSLSMSLSQRHQYLFQTGITGLGMPSEFWMPVHDRFKPQYMRGVTLSGMVEIVQGFTLNASVYYKRLYNQIEYYGSIIDFITTDYNFGDHLIKGDGYNYGFDVMVSKSSGRLTGWLGYSMGRALRHFDKEGMTGYYHASHERIHELDMVAVYNTGKRWEPSLVLVAASGTPFTAPEYFYMLDRKLLVRYGDFNAQRTRPYIRLDLSVNYDLNLRNDRFIKSHGLNLSVYNVLCRHNDLGYRLKVYEDSFYYHNIMFLGFALPSISYYCTF